MPYIERDIERNDEELEDEVDDNDEGEEKSDDQQEGEEQSEDQQNDSENDEQEPPPRPRPKRSKRKKGSKGPCFWFACIFVGLALAVVAGVLIYFFAFPTITCLPAQSYNHLKDVATHYGYQNNLFHGLVTFQRMWSICDRLDKERRLDATKGQEIMLNTKEDDEVFNRDIRANMKDIFGDLPNEKKLMWNGCYYYWDDTKKEWTNHCIKFIHTNFCNKSNWSAEFEKLKTRTDKKDRIYLVKDFGKNETCWQHYNSTNLSDIMGQPAGSIPRLSFACSSESKTVPSGKEAIPGFFKPKPVESGNFFIYKFKTIFEDAKMECENQGLQLVTIDSPAKLTQVEKALDETQLFDNVTHTFWTGGYLDVSNGNTTRDIKWLGSPNTVTKFSKELFKTIDEALLVAYIKDLEKSIKSISKDQVRDCSSHDYLYVGLYHPKALQNGTSRGLAMLNFNGVLDHDKTQNYVLCEKKSG